ncbi:unnamed protein product [Plutella xylostella]|uniref:(diamondback moth) hypothetical protein n=1 Tax=Plutella xylostella TaxID=51655 RepID=A0A8S4G5B6_PLUXY|nr:unnamed protein product [Plutella xylostella]
MFVASGAYNGLDRLVQRRNNEKYLGFGSWDARAGRRAASQAAASDASPLDSAAAENEDRDHWLRKVQARDLIDFGMIPVSTEKWGIFNTVGNSNQPVQDAASDASPLDSAAAENEDIDHWLRKVQARDLIDFGMIPAAASDASPLDSAAAENEDRDHWLRKVQARDLIDFGMIPVSQYKLLFAMDKCSLSFSESALRAVAALAMERKTGARGLRAVMENLLLEVMFEIPGSDITSVHIHEGCVSRDEPPTVARAERTTARAAN